MSLSALTGFVKTALPCLLALLCGCTQNGGTLAQQAALSAALLTSDFTPPSGSAPIPANANGQGPWSRRLLTARSTDEGLSWTKTNTLLVDQGDVPTVVTDALGRIFVYYVTYHVDYRDATVVAVSQDNGSTWVHKEVTFTGLPSGARPPVDPASVLLPDGRIRLYYQAHSSATSFMATYSAVSSDGLNFTVEAGVRYERTDQSVIAPAIFDCGLVHSLFSIEHGTGENLFATSTDGGVNFTTQANVWFPGNYLVANGIAVQGGYRAYLFGGGLTQGISAPSLASAFSTDGLQWTLEAGDRLAFDPTSNLESDTVRDPAVTALLDGSYLMVYVTEIP